MSKLGSWYSALSRKGKTATIIGVSLLGLTAVSAASPKTQQTPAPVKPTQGTTQSQQASGKKRITEKSVIAFTTITRDDATLAKGTTKTTQEGVNGERTTTYEVTYTDGKETGRTKLSEEVTKPPVDKIISNGTYVYVSPTPAPSTSSSGSTSSGARTGAICKDGSSSSATGSGACSHHGGVAYWTY